MRGQFLDHLDRDQPVGAVPVMGKGRDRALGEAAHLVADQLEGLVAQTVAARGHALGEHRAETGPGGGEARD